MWVWTDGRWYKGGRNERIAEGLSDRETGREKQRKEAVRPADPGPGRKPQRYVRDACIHPCHRRRGDPARAAGKPRDFSAVSPFFAGRLLPASSSSRILPWFGCLVGPLPLWRPARTGGEAPSRVPPDLAGLVRAGRIMLRDLVFWGPIRGRSRRGLLLRPGGFARSCCVLMRAHRFLPFQTFPPG